MINLFFLFHQRDNSDLHVLGKRKISEDGVDNPPARKVTLTVTPTWNAEQCPEQISLESGNSP